MLLKDKRIIIVEDNSLNRVVYRITLGLQGASLDFDLRGIEVMDKLNQSSNLNLIILDLMLRGGPSGFSIFQEIRALPQYDHIPIIAVSASEPTVAMPKARELGFSGFISKPVDEAIFAKQIARVIDGEQIWYDGSMHNS